MAAEKSASIIRNIDERKGVKEKEAGGRERGRERERERGEKESRNLLKRFSVLSR